MKRPSSGMHSSGSKPVVPLKDGRGRIVLSVAERLRRYPKGCGKCRHRPGCTPSCYKSRNEI
eukprot:Skav203357  [mRNA]  locus=scaffold1076:515763:515948:- [translate_table: standard]